MKKRTNRVLMGVTASLVLALVLGYVIAVTLSTAKLKRAYAALRTDGRPMEASEVIPPSVLDVDNAGVFYESAIALLKAEPAYGKDLLGYLGHLCGSFVQGSLKPEERPELDQLMQHKVVAQALAMLEESKTRPACQLTRDYGELWAEVPGLLELRSLTHVVGAKTLLQAEAGKSNEAWDTLQVQLRFADALRSSPIIIDQLLRNGMIGFTCRVARELCSGTLPQSEQYERIDALLTSLDDTAPMVRALDGERLLVGERLFALPKRELYVALHRQQSGGEEVPGILWRLLFSCVTFRPVFLADHAYYLQTMHHQTRVMEQPYSPASKDMEGQSERHHLLSSMLLPGTLHIKVLLCRMVAHVRICRTGLALLQYRQAHGALPDTLDQISIGKLMDPFTQEPLHYRAEADGFVVYSVGEDLKDNGGTAQQPRQKTDYDIVWRFPGEREDRDPNGPT